MSIGPCDSLLFWFYFFFYSIPFRRKISGSFLVHILCICVCAPMPSTPEIKKNPRQSTHNCVFYAILCAAWNSLTHNYSRIIRFPHTMWTTVRINDRRINDRPKQPNLARITDPTTITTTYGCSVSVTVTIDILWKQNTKKERKKISM